MKRRSFLASILAAGVAPAAVGSEILMPVKAPIWRPQWVGVDHAFQADEFALFVKHGDAAFRVTKGGVFVDRSYYDGLRWTTEQWIAANSRPAAPLRLNGISRP